MRRQEKEIKSKSEIENIISKPDVCRLALSINNIPYIVPVSFGYKDNSIFIHSAAEGKKIEILRENNNVCLEFDTDTEIIKGEIACKWSMRYRSVIAFGKAYFVEEKVKKRKALEIIMNHYTKESSGIEFSEEALNKTAVIEIILTSMFGKQSGF
ncbi:pyridoxamine 5'-phosphate oxidase family protein [Flexistipes sp.]|uniref:pyridoxamine 5'-phosphate oxidase family protein n=1 Tax=Flexistipes sp. TaxID=3088135 RepID=UPI002E20E388|nr:pyridoxamine 5'-phosphate oxidase family protein [Flexistipes sp.]